MSKLINFRKQYYSTIGIIPISLFSGTNNPPGSGTVPVSFESGPIEQSDYNVGPIRHRANSL